MLFLLVPIADRCVAPYQSVNVQHCTTRTMYSSREIVEDRMRTDFTSPNRDQGSRGSPIEPENEFNRERNKEFTVQHTM
jgi:hypothetical protein